MLPPHRFKRVLGRYLHRGGLQQSRRNWGLDGRLHAVRAASAYSLFAQLMEICPMARMETTIALWRCPAQFPAGGSIRLPPYFQKAS
jgi:hypothetical protein